MSINLLSFFSQTFDTIPTVKGCYTKGLVADGGTLLWAGKVYGRWAECMVMCQVASDCSRWFMDVSGWSFSRVCNLYSGNVTTSVAEDCFIAGGTECS